MKALRRFTVRAHLPERLAALERLSINLRWSWDAPTQDLFATIDSELWEQTGHDPVAPLGGVSPTRLDDPAVDSEFLSRLDHLASVDSYGLPDTPLLGSQLTLTATVQLDHLHPDEVVVQAVVGSVDAGYALLDPITVPMAYAGAADAGNQVFSTTTPLPVARPVEYTVRVLPHHSLLAADNELGLVTLA